MSITPGPRHFDGGFSLFFVVFFRSFGSGRVCLTYFLVVE